MPTNFPELLRLLVSANVDFIIVGGVAARAHGSSRLTEDLDVVYNRSAENIERVYSALSPYHPYLRGAPPGLPFDWSPQTIKNGLNFTLIVDHGAIDLLGEITEITGGGSYDQLQAHSEFISLFGLTCRCLTLDQLIKVKRAAGRPRDLEAIAELTAILEESGGSA
jgi:hypothetical protein